MLYYGSKLSDHIIETDEGYLICLDSPINRIGSQTYLGSELMLDDRTGNERIEIVRDEDDVFDKATLASFEGKPFCNEHPQEDVDSSNITFYNSGHCQNIRRMGDMTIADIYVTDPKTIQDIKNGKREISCGYSCEFEPLGDGRYKQVNIRGNHIALVDSGRAGEQVRIIDSKKEPNTVVNVEYTNEKDLFEQLTSKVSNFNGNGIEYADILDEIHNAMNDGRLDNRKGQQLMSKLRSRYEYLAQDKNEDKELTKVIEKIVPLKDSNINDEPPIGVTVSDGYIEIEKMIRPNSKYKKNEILSKIQQYKTNNKISEKEKRALELILKNASNSGWIKDSSIEDGQSKAFTLALRTINRRDMTKQRFLENIEALYQTRAITESEYNELKRLGMNMKDSNIEDGGEGSGRKTNEQHIVETVNKKGKSSSWVGPKNVKSWDQLEEERRDRRQEDAKPIKRIELVVEENGQRKSKHITGTQEQYERIKRTGNLNGQKVLEVKVVDSTYASELKKVKDSGFLNGLKRILDVRSVKDAAEGINAIRRMIKECKTKNDLNRVKQRFESMNRDKFFSGSDYEVAKQEINNALKNYKLLGIKDISVCDIGYGDSKFYNELQKAASPIKTGYSGIVDTIDKAIREYSSSKVNYEKLKADSRYSNDSEAKSIIDKNIKDVENIIKVLESIKVKLNK